MSLSFELLHKSVKTIDMLKDHMVLFFIFDVEYINMKLFLLHKIEPSIVQVRYDFWFDCYCFRFYKTDSQDITEILLKVALNTIVLTP
jgi:hypothetical protein